MIILITGVGRGLGLALAHECLDHQVAVVGVVRDIATEPVKELAARGAMIFASDVSDPKSIKQLIDDLIKADMIPGILILNAALMEDDMLQDFDISIFKKIISTNLFGPMMIVSQLLPFLRLSGGRIFAISSLSARLATDPRRIGYPSSKAALNMAMSALQLNSDFASIKFTTVLIGRLAYQSGYFLISYNEAAKKIYNLINRKRLPPVVTFPKTTTFIFNIIKHLPSNLRYILLTLIRTRNGYN